MSHVEEVLGSLLAHRRVEGDDENNAILGAIIAGIADALDRFNLIAFGDEDAGIEGGGRVLRDPSVAPLWALAHAAMYVGAQLPGRLPGEDDPTYLARARDSAVYPLGIRRGTHEAILRTVRPHLSGGRTVFINDNYGGPYDLFVRTLAEETPDPALVRRLLEGDFVSGGQPGAIRAELKLSYITGDYAAWPEATLPWNAVADGVTWASATREDLS